jgi:hypothetical protein
LPPHARPSVEEVNCTKTLRRLSGRTAEATGFVRLAPPHPPPGDANRNGMQFTQESEMLVDQKRAAGDPNGKRWGISSAVECFLYNRQLIMRTALQLPIPPGLLTVPRRIVRASSKEGAGNFGFTAGCLPPRRCCLDPPQMELSKNTG